MKILIDIGHPGHVHYFKNVVKNLKSKDHLLTMLYATMSGVSSLRELSIVLLACVGRISHLNLKHFPKRSTLSDANKKITSEVLWCYLCKII
ncbi:DUF4372 domain-containing protein [Flavobacteriaceae bacterium PRS1]|nr:DUF4372 domain-containing protein [Flavobacteriaceae bacterium PRS1]